MSGVNEFLAKKFSRAADSYLDIAYVQREAAKRVCAYFPLDFRPKKVLEIGSGPGVLSGLLLQRFQEAELTCLDLSKKMLNQLSSEYASPRLRCVDSDYLDYKPDTAFDLVVSSSSLHWLSPLEDAFKKTHSLTTEDATFVFSMMIEGTLKELRTIREEVAPEKTVYPHFNTASEIRELLKESGFASQSDEVKEYVESYPDVKSLLKSLRDRGVTASKDKNSLLSRSELKEVMRLYQERFQKAEGEGIAGKGIPATYVVLSCLSRKSS